MPRHLEIRLTVRTRTFRDHVLSLWLSSTRGPPRYLPLKEDVTTSVEVDDGAGLLCVRWYGERADYGQELVAGGSGPLGEIPLCDVAGIVQGVLLVQGTRGAPQPVPNGAEQTGVLAKQLVRQVRDVHRRIGASPDQTLYQIWLPDARLGAVPPLFHALAASRISADASAAVALFGAWLRTFVDMELSPEQQLADLLALPTLAWHYRLDQNAEGKVYDQWASLWAFPNPERAVFDCEDGARAALELFLVLVAADLSRGSLRLQLLQQVARRYTPFLAIGELKRADGDYDAHCYLMLLNRGGGVWPSITVEPTAYASGVWTKDMLSTLEEDKARFSEHSRGRPDQGVIFRSPISMVRDQGLYRRLYALITCHAPGDRSLHLVCRNEKGEFATDTVSLLLDPAEHLARCERAVDMPTAQLERGMAHELSLTPRSTFPSPPPARASQVPPRLLSTRRLHASDRRLPLTDRMALFEVNGV
jgi:hypothetical protein